MIEVCVSNFDEWRSYSRTLLQRHIAPQDICWVDVAESTHTLELFSDSSTSLKEALSCYAVKTDTPTISQSFIQLARNVACYRDAHRWALLYSLAWRIHFENKYLLSDRTDKSVTRAQKMHKIIARDKHKMEAFVRFKKVKANTHHSELNTDEDHYVAWFEPDHLILKDKSSFFVKRFHNMRWSILTPDGCAHWDMQRLHFSKGVSRPPENADESEALWLTYYKNIFNPARLKIDAMQSEMPKKYWKNLPEAAVIKDLISQSSKTTDAMIYNNVGAKNAKFLRSKLVIRAQNQLRNRQEE